MKEGGLETESSCCNRVFKEGGEKNKKNIKTKPYIFMNVCFCFSPAQAKLTEDSRLSSVPVHLSSTVRLRRAPGVG